MRRQPSLEQMRGGPRILTCLPAVALGQEGGEALVVELYRHRQLPADLLGELPCLPGLGAVGAGEREWQSNDHPLDAQLTHQAAQTTKPAAGPRTRDRLDRSGKQTGGITDRTAATSAAVVEGKHSHGP